MDSMPCSNTAALSQYEHDQYIAERELVQAIQHQCCQGIDPIEQHIDDMLNSRDFYEHAGLALADNGLIAPLLELVMCGPYGEGPEVLREILCGLARMHAKAAVDEQAGLYVQKYDANDVDPSAAVRELREYLAGLAA